MLNILFFYTIYIFYNMAEFGAIIRQNYYYIWLVFKKVMQSFQNFDCVFRNTSIQFIYNDNNRFIFRHFR